MIDRKKGPYWVRRAEGDASQGVWEIMHWEGQWFRDHTDSRLYDADLSVVGPFVPNPDQMTSLYDLLEASDAVAKVLDIVEDIPDVVYVPGDDITADEIRGTTAIALRKLLAANAKATAARLYPNETPEGDVP